VTGPPWLTNRAVAAGTVAGGNAPRETGQIRGERLPRSVNTRPPLAAMGLTAEQATAAGQRVATPTADLALSARAAILGDPRGALKLVVDQDTQEILGAHMVGLESTEVIAQVVLAMEAGSATGSCGPTTCIPPWRRWLAWPSAWTTSPGMRDRRQAQRRKRSA
jgi:dihydrolipoamide dehydrogenase